jgi:hypothetical protein
MKRWWIALGTAVAAAAGEGVVHYAAGGDPVSGKGVGLAAAVAAISGLIAYLKTSPPPVEAKPEPK